MSLCITKNASDPLLDAKRGRVWTRFDKALDATPSPDPQRVHILSPFDPLIIQRKRLALLFEYEHRFEAYVPKEKRVMGYFALQVLVGDEIVAAIDLKTDREKMALRIQQWTWLGKNTKRHKSLIERELERFEHFQFGFDKQAQWT